MTGNQDIEAKLCAYVDGEIDAQERAEIEQHLQANPQHRALLEELMQQRKLLGALPREPAPEDLYESFQAHLERSVLLDASEEDDLAPLRISRWPQVLAIAAVLVLAVGLGAIIFMMLPGTTDVPTEFTMVTPAPVESAESVADEALALRDAAPAVEEHAHVQPAGPVERAEADDVFAEGFDDGRIAPIEEHLAGLFDDDREGVGERDRGRLVVLVSTHNPAAAQTQLVEFLGVNNIAFEEVPALPPAPLALRQSQAVDASRLTQTRMQLKRVPDEVLVQKSSEPEKTEAPAARYGARVRAEEPSAPAPAGAFPAEQLAESGQILTNVAPHPGFVKQPQQQQAIIARGLTKDQLLACVAAVEPTANAEVYELSKLAIDTDARAVQLPSRQVTARTDSVAPPEPTDTITGETIQDDDLVAISVGQDQVQLQRIDEEGKVSVPSVGRVEARGRDVRELASEIADAYRANQDAPQDSRVIVRRVVTDQTTPATAPLADRESAPDGFALNAPFPMTILGWATELNDHLDVLIVLHHEPAPETPETSEIAEPESAP